MIVSFLVVMEVMMILAFALTPVDREIVTVDSEEHRFVLWSSPFVKLKASVFPCTNTQY